MKIPTTKERGALVKIYDDHAPVPADNTDWKDVIHPTPEEETCRYIVHTRGGDPYVLCECPRNGFFVPNWAAPLVHREGRWHIHVMDKHFNPFPLVRDLKNLRARAVAAEEKAANLWERAYYLERGLEDPAGKT